MFQYSHTTNTKQRPWIVILEGSHGTGKSSVASHARRMQRSSSQQQNFDIRVVNDVFIQISNTVAITSPNGMGKLQGLYTQLRWVTEIHNTMMGILKTFDERHNGDRTQILIMDRCALSCGVYCEDESLRVPLFKIADKLLQEMRVGGDSGKYNILTVGLQCSEDSNWERILERKKVDKVREKYKEDNKGHFNRVRSAYDALMSNNKQKQYNNLKTALKWTFDMVINTDKYRTSEVYNCILDKINATN